MPGDGKNSSLSCKLIALKKELKAISEKLRHQKRLTKRKTRNKRFNLNQTGNAGHIKTNRRTKNDETLEQRKRGYVI